MIELIDFEQPGEENDRLVQMALREIDMTDLAHAAVAMDSRERDIVYRNMSTRARAQLVEQVAQAETAVSERDSRASKEFFVQKLRKHKE